MNRSNRTHRNPENHPRILGIAKTSLRQSNPEFLLYHYQPGYRHKIRKPQNILWLPAILNAEQMCNNAYSLFPNLASR